MASEPLLPEKGAVHVAAQQGDVAKLRQLSGDQLREVFCGATALHLAAAANQLRAMDVLLEVFAVDALDQLGRTPLMHATFAKSAEAMVWLVHRKAALENL
ncbi:unnamed protein product [Cladocopium goreaui]|uniref:Transient receptor potential cation channel subfamily A member 1 homolog n=1 Tax=Cladocopium goreaui TaxID=2562237 RepID=A0A9P1CLD5_9DINO|nr:unnamed protein product [Cladocopium goreaui]